MIAKVRKRLSLWVVSVNLLVCAFLFLEAHLCLFPEGPLLIWCIYAPQTLSLCLSSLFLLSTAISKEHLPAKLALTSLLLSLAGQSGLCFSHPSAAKGNFTVSTLNADSWFCNKPVLRQYVTDNQADVLMFSEMWDPTAIADCGRDRPDLKWYRPLEQLAPELAIATALKATQLPSPSDWVFPLLVESKSGPLLICATRYPKGRELVGDLKIRQPEELNRVQKETSEAILKLIHDTHLPTIVGGDFNSPPYTPARYALRNDLTDCFEARGLGFGLTFPNKFPLWRLDCVLVSGDIKVVRCNVVSKTGSDHQGLNAELVLPQAEFEATGAK